jgi:hypothetical protein
MKKEELLAKLEVAKEVTSVVSIDLIISALNELKLPVKTGITQELADEIANKIEQTLDYNCDDLVCKDEITFEITYGNQIEVDEAQINVGETMEHITAVLDGFIVGEDEDDKEEPEQTESGLVQSAMNEYHELGNN